MPNRSKSEDYCFLSCTKDFVIKKYHFSVVEALKFLTEYASFSFQPPVVIEEEDKPKFQNETTIQHPALIEYLESRAILKEVYTAFCQEVYYWNKGKRYFAIGFKNDSEGYELRTKHHKACLGAKDITYINNENNQLLVFEGFFDFLSYLTLNRISHLTSNVIVLNSVANAKKAIPALQKYEKAILYLDNDETGDKYTRELEKVSNNVHDGRDLYKGYKDLNEYLINNQL